MSFLAPGLTCGKLHDILCYACHASEFSFHFELPVVDVICGKSGRKEVEHLKRPVN